MSNQMKGRRKHYAWRQFQKIVFRQEEGELQLLKAQSFSKHLRAKTKHLSRTDSAYGKNDESKGNQETMKY